MKENIVIVIPYYKNSINDFEKKSWKSLIKFYPNIPKIGVMPKGVSFPIKHPSIIKTEYLDPSYFKSVHATNKYYLNKQFYKRFIVYEYMLLFELDCLIVKDNLSYWLNKNYSYIGAPTVKKSLLHFSNRAPRKLKYFCNGGFSLRKISHFINVLESDKFYFLNNYTWRELKRFKRILDFSNLYFKSKKSKNPSQFFARFFYLNEDVFWSYFAKLFDKNFKCPSPSNLQYMANFAIDTGPEFVRTQINEKHPFAYHKLFAYNLKLWQDLTKQYE